ncbi:MAG: glycosyltransferase family 4 protein [Chloroflexi bacterium]|nr:glycosyltransferase family 4 protein [Chloroflexota bacterium]
MYSLRVVLANYTLSMMRGGGETRDLALGTSLQRLGLEVEIVTVQPIMGRVRHPVTELPCRYLPSPYFRDVVYRLMQVPKAGRLAAFLLKEDVRQFSRRLVETLARPAEQLDVLQAAGLYPVVALKKRRDVRVVIRNQGGLPPKHLRRFVPLADAIIGDGWDAENFARQLGRELVEIPGGVDAELFRPGAPDLRAALGLESAEVVLFVGRFVPLKNVALLVDAFQRLARRRPTAKLLLVGEGALEGALRAQVRQLGLERQVVFAGAQALAALPSYYATSDVFALPSSFDNSPNVLLEAMACGVPVVATDVGGVHRYVSDGVNGLLVPTRDPDVLAAALERVLTDRALRDHLVEHGRARVSAGFDWTTSARKLLSLYEELLGRVPR